MGVGVGVGSCALCLSGERGSLGKREYVRLRVRPLNTLSAEQVSLEATVGWTMVHPGYRHYLWPADMKVVLWLVAADVVYSC